MKNVCDNVARPKVCQRRQSTKSPKDEKSVKRFAEAMKSDKQELHTLMDEAFQTISGELKELANVKFLD